MILGDKLIENHNLEKNSNGRAIFRKKSGWSSLRCRVMRLVENSRPKCSEAAKTAGPNSRSWQITTCVIEPPCAVVLYPCLSALKCSLADWRALKDLWSRRSFVGDILAQRRDSCQNTPDRWTHIQQWNVLGQHAAWRRRISFALS